MIKPIKTYDAYFMSTDIVKLYGLESDKITVIDVIDQDGDIITLKDFFTKSGVLYFATIENESQMIDDVETTIQVEHFYSQKDGKITELDSLPEKPTTNRAHYTSKEFTISDFDYKGKACTDVKNLTCASGIERFFMVDNFIHFDGKGIYFNVPDGRYAVVDGSRNYVRIEGLYFWGVGIKPVEYLVGDGSLWKM